MELNPYDYYTLLPEQCQEKLGKLPEQGMGWQMIDVYLKDGRVLRNVVCSGCQGIDKALGVTTDDIWLVTLSDA